MQDTAQDQKDPLTPTDMNLNQDDTSQAPAPTWNENDMDLPPAPPTDNNQNMETPVETEALPPLPTPEVAPETLPPTPQVTPEPMNEIPQPQPIGFGTASMQNTINPLINEELDVPPGAPPQEPPSLKDQGSKGRKILFVTLTILLVIAFSALGYYVYSQFFQGNGNNEEPITLTYWGLWESKEVIQPLIDAYQEEHPNVTINYEERSPEFYFETLQSRLGKETGPDIVRIHNTWAKPLQTQLSPLPNTVMDKSTYESTFYSVTAESLLLDNAYYGMPIGYDGLALIYNESLFLEAGIKNPPSTWEEFRDIARKLTKKETNEKGEEQIVQAGAAIGYSNIEHFSDLLGLLMAQNGVEFEDELGNLAIATTISPDGRNLGAEALSFYSIFSKGDDRVWNEDWISAHDAFSSEKLAMMFGPSWRVMNLLESNKNLKIKVAPVPQIPLGEDETTNVNWGSYWAEAVSKTAKDQAVAWDFVNFMTQREQMVKMFTIASEGRIFGEPYARQDLYSSLSSDPYLAPYIKTANTATSWSMCDRTYDSIYNDEIVDIFAEAIDTVNNDGSPETAIEKAATGIKQVLSEL